MLADGPDSLAVAPSRRSTVVAVAWILAALLPLVGLISLLARSKLDPGWTNTRVHFVLFLSVATVDSCSRTQPPTPRVAAATLACC